MGKADRLLLILNLIRARKNLTPKDLSKECGVSERTIYRDINAISKADIPIYYDNGYKFFTDAFLPPLNLSLDENLALYMGLNSEDVNSQAALKSAGKTALAKIESLLSETIRDDYFAIRTHIETHNNQEEQG
jgi:predicted DNA-binding transcriptional regulator YafY